MAVGLRSIIVNFCQKLAAADRAFLWILQASIQQNNTRSNQNHHAVAAICQPGRCVRLTLSASKADV
jgi:hypothetical protein